MNNNILNSSQVSSGTTRSGGQNTSEVISVGPFGIKLSTSTRGFFVNKNSNILIGTNLSSKLNIINIETEFKFQSDGITYLWLEVEIGPDNGVPQRANLKIGNGEWWEKFPETQVFSGNTKNITSQTRLYACVATVAPSSAGLDGVMVDTYTVYRHIYQDLMLFQTCGGFIFLPSPCAAPLTV